MRERVSGGVIPRRSPTLTGMRMRRFTHVDEASGSGQSWMGLSAPEARIRQSSRLLPQTGSLASCWRSHGHTSPGSQPCVGSEEAGKTPTSVRSLKRNVQFSRIPLSSIASICCSESLKIRNEGQQTHQPALPVEESLRIPSPSDVPPSSAPV